MAGQGGVTLALADELRERGWHVAFACIPNAPHVRVVPIPTENGAGRQRYPDILAFRQDRTLLLEVEVDLTEAVAENIKLRLSEQIAALSNTQRWSAYRQKLATVTKAELPPHFRPTLALALCKPLRPEALTWQRQLELVGIITGTSVDVLGQLS